MEACEFVPMGKMFKLLAIRGANRVKMILTHSPIVHTPNSRLSPNPNTRKVGSDTDGMNTMLASKIHRNRIRNAIMLMLALLNLGCRTQVPMVVWKDSAIPKLRVQRIAMAPVTADPAIREKIEVAMQKQKPAAANQIAFLDPRSLEQTTQIQLASYDGQPSDVGCLSASRRAGSQVLLQAQVLNSDLNRTPDESQDPEYRPESISVGLTLVDVNSGEKIATKTVSFDRKQAEKEYPDLEFMGASGGDRVIAATARKSWEWMTPHLETEKTSLMRPWISLGSKRVRQGNAYAKEGRWDLAEKEWQEAVDTHRLNKSGWYNLALSAAAREDFELARRRMKHAKSWYQPIPAEAGAVWIEQRQREYHRIFQLPDPTDGWTFPEPVRLTSKDVPSSIPSKE